MPEEAKKARRHRRGEGATYPLKDGGWMAQLQVGYDRRTGKRRYVRRRATDEKDADRKLTRLQLEWGRAGDVAFQRLDDYLADWLDGIEGTIAPSTLRSYRGHVDNHIAPLLGAITVGALRPDDVKRLIRRATVDGSKPATVGRIVTTLRMALQQAVREGELVTNPALVKLPRVTREPVEAMTAAKAEAILATVRAKGADGKASWMEPIITLLLGTGMRAGEACALDWRDLDLEAGTVLIRAGKTRAATRTIHLVPFVVRSLERHRAATPRYGPREPVFLGPLRSRKTRQLERTRVDAVSHAFPDLLEARGMDRMRVHDLRHGTATLLLARGVPMRVISEVLGHANPALTARLYAHVGDESKRAAMALLADLDTAVDSQEA